MATASSTATAIELEPFSRSGAVYRDPGQNRDLDTDNIIQASQEADSTVPDGGYGWVVIIGCAIVTWWFVGTTYCWGVFQNALAKEGLSSPSTLAFVGSVSAGLMATLATVSARATRMMGTRYSGMLGIGLIGLGEILSGSAVHNVGALFITAGFIVGIGMSLCFMIVSVVTAQYFSRKRGLANGIVFAGGGLGGAVTSFVIDALIERLGISWAYRLLGFITLATGLPAAWLIKERTRIRTSSVWVEWRLFRDFKFVIIFIAGAIGTFPLFVPPFFLPLYRTSIGLSSGPGAGLVAAFNFSSAIGRIISGLSCDWIGPLNALFISLAISALSMLALWPMSDTLAPLIIFAIVNGAANGGFFATMPTVIGNVFGSARVGVAMGMIVSGWAAGYLMGSPIAGYLLEAYGGEQGGLKAYRPAMYYAGSLALASAGLVAIVRLRITTKLFAKV